MGHIVCQNRGSGHGENKGIEHDLDNADPIFSEVVDMHVYAAVDKYEDECDRGEEGAKIAKHVWMDKAEHWSDEYAYTDKEEYVGDATFAEQCCKQVCAEDEYTKENEIYPELACLHGCGWYECSKSR